MLNWGANLAYDLKAEGIALGKCLSPRLGAYTDYGGECGWRSLWTKSVAVDRAFWQS